MVGKSLEYDRFVENALRAVVREALLAIAEEGLPGEHHFYITFATDHPGAKVAKRLRKRYPREMTIVLQHQYSNLVVSEKKFGVTLSFSGVAEHLEIPYEAITAFADPSVQFGLQFRRSTEEEYLEDAGKGGEDTDWADADTVELPRDRMEGREANTSRIPDSGSGKKNKPKEKAKQKDKVKDGEKDGKSPSPATVSDDEDGKVVALDRFRKK